MIDISIYLRPSECEVKTHHTAHGHWVDIPAIGCGADDELTIFVGSHEAAGRLADGFVAAGAARVRQAL